jgi:hypothetical protein
MPACQSHPAGLNRIVAAAVATNANSWYSDPSMIYFVAPSFYRSIRRFAIHLDFVSTKSSRTLVVLESPSPGAALRSPAER